MSIGCNVTMENLDECLVMDFQAFQFYTHTTKPFLPNVNDEQYKKLVDSGKTLYVHSTFNTIFDMHSGRAKFGEQLMLCKKYGVKGIVLHIPNRPVDELVNGFKCFNNPDFHNSGVVLYLEHVPGEYSISKSTLGELYSGLKQRYKKFEFGICIDTCHIYSSGVDISDPTIMQSWINWLKELKVKVLVHLNDSIGEMGSMIDRHAPVGYKIWTDDKCSSLKLLLNTQWDCIIELKNIEDIEKSFNFIKKIEL